MARPQIGDRHVGPTHRPQPPAHPLLVERQEDVWFIRFDGTEYGPYKSEREAMLFAVDAANKLGEQGEETQVLRDGRERRRSAGLDLRARRLPAEAVSARSVRIAIAFIRSVVGGAACHRP